MLPAQGAAEESVLGEPTAPSHVGIAAANRRLLALGVLAGLPFVPLILTETVYSVTQLQFDGHYWCDSVGE